MQHKIAVIYSSKYGATKKYATWIAQELSADLYDVKNAKLGQILNYDTIIYGGGLYAGGVRGIGFITKNYNELSDKNMILYTCGLADTNKTANVDHIYNGIKKKLTTQMLSKVKIFHLRGGINYEKLSIPHKILMKILAENVKKKDDSQLSNEDKCFLDTYGKAVDFTDKASLNPLFNYVKEVTSYDKND